MMIKSEKQFEHSVSKVVGLGKRREGWGKNLTEKSRRKPLEQLTLVFTPN